MGNTYFQPSMVKISSLVHIFPVHQFLGFFISHYTNQVKTEMQTCLLEDNGKHV